MVQECLREPSIEGSGTCLPRATREHMLACSFLASQTCRAGLGVYGAAWGSMHALPSLHLGIVCSLITADAAMAQGELLP